ncbi:hypothetical protein ABZ923_34475 [Streptomyces sp. NPDC046881]|uniref:hypothetical protein n=1 Tax=Streptomyces sp. NPDC046881 TaxID=3155374 RepID=UPI0033C7DC2D
MGCACQGNASKPKYEVVTTVVDPRTQQEKEKVVFTSASKPTATTVGKRYPGSTIREVPPKNATTAKTAGQ